MLYISMLSHTGSSFNKILEFTINHYVSLSKLCHWYNLSHLIFGFFFVFSEKDKDKEKFMVSDFNKVSLINHKN